MTATNSLGNRVYRSMQLSLLFLTRPISSSSTPLVTMNVRLHEPELVQPTKGTPRGLKPLSDIDDQESLRMHIPIMQFYPRGSGQGNGDPARVIREALGKTLVYYYPWAGRLREGPNRKLAVDCTGEGVLFVEAEADDELRDVAAACDGGFLRPPFPKELLCDMPGSSSILHCPLLHFQVTKLKCGGFVFAMRLNHTMSDASGVIQFLICLAEFARGACVPSIIPIWERSLLCSRDPPCVTFLHREYDNAEGTPLPIHHDGDTVIERSFFFGPNELYSLRHHLLTQLKCCSTFELLSAFLWRCRTIALRFDPHQEVKYFCLVNARSKLNPRLPPGYYGNAFVFPAAVSTASELLENDLGYAVGLIKKAKAKVTEEYVRSVTDFLASNGRPPMTIVGSWVVSDNKKVGYLDIDFGWGKPIYGGPSSSMVGTIHGPIGFFVKGVNGKGESGFFALVCLPTLVMERFAREVNYTIEKPS